MTQIILLWWLLLRSLIWHLIKILKNSSNMIWYIKKYFEKYENLSIFSWTHLISFFLYVLRTFSFLVVEKEDHSNIQVIKILISPPN